LYLKHKSEPVRVPCGTDPRFPYPATEDWQKAVEAFNIWISGDAKATSKDGILTYTVTYTIHGEDEYNFNPGMHDVATGTPDNVNGQFELTGLAKQFKQTGEATFTITWQVNSKQGTASEATQDNVQNSKAAKKEKSHVVQQHQSTRNNDRSPTNRHD
jgi:hypothetical protein